MGVSKLSREHSLTHLPRALTRREENRWQTALLARTNRAMDLLGEQLSF
jgi:hypothetical protein